MTEIPTCLEGNKLILRAPNINFASLMQQAIQESFYDLNFWLDWAKNIRHSRDITLSSISGKGNPSQRGL